MELFNDEYNLIYKKFKEFKKKTMIMSYLRLLSFLLIISFIIMGAFLNNIFYYVSMLMIIVFIILIIIHQNYFYKFNNNKNKLNVISMYNQRLNNEWKMFKDDGSNYIKDFKDSDLDLFGKNSLYQYISICKTKSGKDLLANYLKNGNPEVNKMQNLITSIKNNNDFIIDFESSLMDYNPILSKSPDTIDKMINEKYKFKYIYLLGSIIFTILNIIFIVLGLLKIINFSYFTISFLLNVIYSSLFINKSVIGNIIDIINMLNNYNSSINTVNDYEINDPYYNELKNNLKDTLWIKRIKKINTLISFRENGISWFLFNGLFGIDIVIMFLYKLYKKGDISINKIVSSISILECALSLNVITITKKNVTLPIESDSLELLGIVHPLINEKTAVLNDFKLNNNRNIITGSNMSGKTTFLRTIGVNMVLFNAGGYVNATSFKSKKFNILTSMRIADDLSNGISTFYSELLKIKEIIEKSKENNNLLVLIDEIFRGTNSKDRIIGAKAVINELNNTNIISFFTTHDMEVSDIDCVSNYHFDEYYKDDKIYFDYKIKEGISNTTNAQYLMKMVGIKI